MKIRAISLWEPWATAWAIQLKKGETRSWEPIVDGQPYRGPLAVCSAKAQRDPDEGHRLEDWFDLRMQNCVESRRAFSNAGFTQWRDFKFGHVIAICQLADVRPTRLCGPHNALENSWGNFGPSRFVWLPAKMTRLVAPIPVIGRQGLFHWEVPQSLFADPRICEVLGIPF